MEDPFPTGETPPIRTLTLFKHVRGELPPVQYSNRMGDWPRTLRRLPETLTFMADCIPHEHSPDMQCADGLNLQ